LRKARLCYDLWVFFYFQQFHNFSFIFTHINDVLIQVETERKATNWKIDFLIYALRFFFPKTKDKRSNDVQLCYEYLPLIDFSMLSLLLFVLIFFPAHKLSFLNCNFLESLLFANNLSLVAQLFNDPEWEKIALARLQFFFFVSFALICSTKMIMKFKACN
jgi:hypothetical protein